MKIWGLLDPVPVQKKNHSAKHRPSSPLHLTQNSITIAEDLAVPTLYTQNSITTLPNPLHEQTHHALAAAPCSTNIIHKQSIKEKAHVTF
jgi:hypothetical protein